MADIICLQEHWLYKFEKERLQDLLPRWKGQHIRCFDENLLLPNTHRPGGRGGVATLWKEHLSPYANSQEDDGNERIIVTTFNIPSFPLCVINCYLPSGNSTDALSYFREDMDVLHTLLVKFENYNIVIAGDLNEDHFHRCSMKEKRIKELIEEHKLHDTGNTDQDYTYINPHLGHQSRIDHILLKPLNCTSQKLPHARLAETESHTNTSKHLPLRVRIRIDKLKVKTKHKIRSKKIFDYSKADPIVFSNKLEEELTCYNMNLVDPGSAIAILQHALKTAALTAIPYREVKMSGKRPSNVWSPEIAQAVKNSKLAKFNWDQAGRPKENHPLWIQKKSATKAVRSAQRQEEAQRRRQLLDQISEAHVNDAGLFYKLLKKQKNSSSHRGALLINGDICTDEDTIRKEFADVVERLATPTSSEDHTKDLIAFMRDVSAEQDDVTLIDTRELHDIISTLKSNKAEDKEGLRAEHLKLLTNSKIALKYLAATINQIFKNCTLPCTIKAAYKTPVPKAGKNPLMTDNYRGITITSIFSKLIEHIIRKISLNHINHEQSGLQLGFTEGSSPNMASLLVTEAIAESKEMRTSLVISSLDARKAFDIVSHDKLKFKLYNTPICRSHWRLIDSIYSDNTETIRWMGTDSNPYSVKQGVRQGGILSADLYKLYSNDQQTALEKMGIGLHIGDIYVGAPAVADDQLLIANNGWEMQSMLSICFDYAEDHQAQLHPDKSTVTEMLKNSSSRQSDPWYLGDNPATETESFQHLGLRWSSGRTSPDCEERVKTARRTAYALMGVGMYGCNGLDPPASMKIVSTYVTPRLLHGLNACSLTAGQVDRLSNFYKKLLRQIQGLYSNTAIVAVYLMIGALPIEALLDLSALSLFGAISRLPPESPLRRLAIRQLSMKMSTSKSWFAYLIKTGEKYNIDVCSVMIHPWPKLVWKKFCKESVTQKWLDDMKQEAQSKRTLSWLIINDEWIGKAHPTWLYCTGKTYHVEAATTRVRMLLGRYGLQYEKYEFTKESSNNICKLCNKDTEDMIHFITSCEKRPNDTDNMIRDLQKMYEDDNLTPPSSETEVTSAVLNGWGYKMDYIKLNSSHKSGNHKVISHINHSHKKHSHFKYSHKSPRVESLKAMKKPAVLLCNSICHKLHRNRSDINLLLQ